MSKYKVGDRVRIIDRRGEAWNFLGEMDKWMGKIMTIREILPLGTMKMVEDRKERSGYGWDWTDGDIAEKVGNHKIVITTDGKTTLARLYEGDKVIKSTQAVCSPDDTFNFDYGAKLAFNRLMFGTDYHPAEVAFKSETPHKWNIGDEVVVADRDEAYPTYPQWFDENNLAHLKPRYGNELVNGETVKILAYGKHDVFGIAYGALYAAEKQDGKIGLIGEIGLADKPKYYSGKVVCVETDKSYWGETLVVGRVYAVEDGRFVHDNGTKTANQTYTDVPGFKEVFAKAKFVEFKGEAQ